MEIIVKVVGILVVVFAIVIASCIPVFYLWNWLMPAIFGLKTITFWQAVGLTFLCSFLFKSTISSESKSSK